MISCAQKVVFWPGIARDIEAIQAKYHACNCNSPSQQPSKTHEVFDPPTTNHKPFEKMFFFQFDSRLSG